MDVIAALAKHGSGYRMADAMRRDFRNVEASERRAWIRI
jgi:hypothetical protein